MTSHLTAATTLLTVRAHDAQDLAMRLRAAHAQASQHYGKRLRVACRVIEGSGHTRACVAFAPSTDAALGVSAAEHFRNLATPWVWMEPAHGDQWVLVSGAHGSALAESVGALTEESVAQVTSALMEVKGAQLISTSGGFDHPRLAALLQAGAMRQELAAPALPVFQRRGAVYGTLDAAIRRVGAPRHPVARYAIAASVAALISGIGGIAVWYAAPGETPVASLPVIETSAEALADPRPLAPSAIRQAASLIWDAYRRGAPIKHVVLADGILQTDAGADRIPPEWGRMPDGEGTVQSKDFQRSTLGGMMVLAKHIPAIAHLESLDLEIQGLDITGVVTWRSF